MTTISLPSWFDVAECEAQLVPEVRGFSGPYGGPTEVQDLLGDRWQLRLTLPDGNHGHGAQSEALFNRLHGGADWLRLHHFARPVPRGTGRGSLVLSSAVAQGANTLALAGCLPQGVLLRGAFGTDANSDGLSDGLTAYAAGSSSGVVYSRPGGTWGNNQRAVATSLGAALGDQVGFRFTASVPVVEGLEYSYGADLFGNSTNEVALECDFYTAGNAYLGRIYQSWPGNGISFSRRSVSGTAPAGAAYVVLYVFMHSGSGASPEIRADNVQFEQSAAPTSYGALLGTLLTGDMLGHNGEQLFQVADDAVANDVGQISVSLVNRARKAISSGQAIVWDKPQVPFQLMSPGGVATAYTRGRARGQQVEFVEAWA